MAKQLIRFDWAIKRLLRSKANFGILEGFLSELLKQDIKIINLLESESNKEDLRANNVYFSNGYTDYKWLIIYERSCVWILKEKISTVNSQVLARWYDFLYLYPYF